MKLTMVLLSCLLHVFLYLVSIQKSTCSLLGDIEGVFVHFDPDVDLNITQFLQKYGYPVEEHEVQTGDGYILSMQRVPHGRYENVETRQKAVVLMGHSVYAAADQFVVNFPNQSLGYILPDAGYDVWFTNMRGNRYSRRHVRWTTKDKEFWDFSWQEMAQYDLTAQIDYVLNVTGQDQLFYVGESMGATAMFALLSEYPEYNRKVRLHIGLSPVAYCGHMKGFIKRLLQVSHFLDYVFGPSESLYSPAGKAFNKYMCNSVFNGICIDFIYNLGKSTQLNETRIGVYLTHIPAGTSTRTPAHYAQLVKNNKFQKFDFGKRENLRRYGQETPPRYDLSRITAPTALLWGSNDLLATPEDVDRLRHEIRSLVSDYNVPDDTFTHLDFAIGLRAHELVFNEVLRLLQQF